MSGDLLDAVKDVLNMLSPGGDKPACPHCGGTNVSVQQHSGGFTTPTQHRILCLGCQAGGPLADSPTEAVEKWKARV